jgi:hypothetical protein
MFENPQLNYIDPGTGSYIMQTLLAAGVVVISFFSQIKIYFLRFLNIIFRK